MKKKIINYLYEVNKYAYLLWFRMFVLIHFKRYRNAYFCEDE